MNVVVQVQTHPIAYYNNKISRLEYFLTSEMGQRSEILQ